MAVIELIDRDLKAKKVDVKIKSEEKSKIEDPKKSKKKDKLKK